jgi:tRNA (mo5U34)-methyltransferase
MGAEEQQTFLRRYKDVYTRYLRIKDRTPKVSAPAPTKAKTATSQVDADKFRWFHSIDLGNGVVTKGQKSVAHLERQAETVFKHSVQGKSVLDIGAWDGAMSFAAERRGAARVLATDHFCWVGPGWGRKAAFDFACRALKSKVESEVADLTDLSVESVGQFDVVLFLGVFYHLLHPLLRLETIAPLARELLVLDTDTALDDEDRPAMVFFPGKELNNDASNWWAPNIKCMKAMLRHVGFRKVDVSPTHPYDGNINHRRGRFTFHAWR